MTSGARSMRMPPAIRQEAFYRLLWTRLFLATPLRPVKDGNESDSRGNGPGPGSPARRVPSAACFHCNERAGHRRHIPFSAVLRLFHIANLPANDYTLVK